VSKGIELFSPWGYPGSFCDSAGSEEHVDHASDGQPPWRLVVKLAASYGNIFAFATPNRSVLAPLSSSTQCIKAILN
jgi:hypothetical protein